MSSLPAEVRYECGSSGIPRLIGRGGSDWLADGRSTPEEIPRFVAAYVTSGYQSVRDPDDGGRVPRDYPGRSPLEHFQSVVDLLGEPRIFTDHCQRFAIGAAVNEPTEQGRGRKGGSEERRADR
ncbi:hypothetical protein ACQ86E_31085 [Bradyrhizobium betae]|uniref:hypothetical protein n=1 Tax=Bradyrhizobium betae TaxID=244734 RepID=UPI003D67E77A